VFSLNPISFKFQLGKKGDGPHDFKYLPYVFVHDKFISCTDFTKTIWYNKNGKVIKVKNYSEFKDFDLNSEMLLIPSSHDTLVRITCDHERSKRDVVLLDSNFNFITKLHQGPFVWKQTDPIPYRTHTQIYKDRIFISDSEKGFFIKVFNIKGEHLKTIDKSKSVGPAVPPYPLLHHFIVKDNKIYVTTFKKRDHLQEMIIMDLKGNILKRIFLPIPAIKSQRGSLRFDLFDIHDGKIYQLLKDNEAKKWRLHISKIKYQTSQ
jgi:hypothetical protein